MIGHWQSGLRPNAHSYGAMVYLNIFLQCQLVSSMIIMAGFVVARSLARRLDVVRRASFESLSLLHYYAVGQGVLGLLLVHGFPRLALG